MSSSSSLLRASVAVAALPCAWSALRGSGNVSVQFAELAGPKPLKTPEEYLGQLAWNAVEAHTACSEDAYDIPETLFGLIKHMDGKDDTNFYPTDKAVAWASGSSGLKKNLQDCCGKDAKQCLCNIAKNVGLLDPSNALYTGSGEYSFIAFDGALGGAGGSVGIAVLSPTWANLAQALPKTYAWVFNDMTLTAEAEAKLRDEETCGLASTMETLQKISDRFELGTDGAFKFVFDTYMSPACTATSCPCKGWPKSDDTCDALCKDGYCGDKSVELFCGTGGSKACDPSQFLCKRSDGQEVGYVRAYLEMFLDCVSVFQGNGCSSGSKEKGDCVEEFIAFPNPEIKRQVDQKSAATLKLVSEMPGQCTPDN